MASSASLGSVSDSDPSRASSCSCLHCDCDSIETYISDFMTGRSGRGVVYNHTTYLVHSLVNDLVGVNTCLTCLNVVDYSPMGLKETVLPKKMPRTTTLSLNMPRAASPVSSAITSPAASETTSTSPQSAKHEDHTFDNKENQTNKAVEQQTMAPRIVEPPSVTEVPASPDLTSLPPYPSSPESAPKHVRDPSKSFFSNLKASKSSNRVHHVEPTIRQVPEESAAADPDLAQNTLYSMRKGTGSTPDLGKSSLGFEPQDSNSKYEV